MRNGKHYRRGNGLKGNGTRRYITERPLDILFFSQELGQIRRISFKLYLMDLPRNFRRTDNLTPAIVQTTALWTCCCFAILNRACFCLRVSPSHCCYRRVRPQHLAPAHHAHLYWGWDVALAAHHIYSLVGGGYDVGWLPVGLWCVLRIYFVHNAAWSVRHFCFLFPFCYKCL